MTTGDIPPGMIIERARVLRVSANTAWVHCESQSGCARCEAGEGCGGGLFSKLLRGRLQALPVALPGALAGGLGSGDRVLVGLSARAVQTASLLLYGLPLAGLLAGAVGAHLAWGGDAAALAGAIAGLAAGLLLASLKARRLAGDAGLAPVLLRRLGAHEPCPGALERRQ